MYVISTLKLSLLDVGVVFISASTKLVISIRNVFKSSAFVMYELPPVVTSDTTISIAIKNAITLFLECVTFPFKFFIQ